MNSSPELPNHLLAFLAIHTNDPERMRGLLLLVGCSFVLLAGTLLILVWCLGHMSGTLVEGAAYGSVLGSQGRSLYRLLAKYGKRNNGVP